ncbi:hypothetical protein B0O99DRAFT_690358 [Bisporella sp. PMI_857]|nr:hypothetical protein B0O99DRAFT_690358 [Bisporella sp. PMI_857]
MAPKDSKGKSTDLSSPWSEWIWTNGDADSPSGFWYASRYNAQGELEYDYRYPETTQSGESPQGTQSVPRSPGPNVITETFDSVSPGFPPPSGAYTTATPTSGPSNSGALGYSSNRPIPYNAYFSSYNNTGQPANEEVSGYPYANPHSQASGSISPASTVRPDVYSTPVIPPPPIQNFSDLSITTPYPPKTHDASHSSDANYGGNTGSYNDGSSTDTSGLYARYEVSEGKSQRSFWKVGRVFATLWTEPARDQSVSSEQIQTIWLGGKAFSEIRRFVVLQNGHGNSICCPIHTYNNRATLKDNLPDVQQHAIIYTSSKPPDEYWYKDDDGSKVYENLSKEPIKVKRETTYKEGDLGTSSRLNYSKLYTVEHYSRVLNIGMVEDRSMAALHKSSFVRRDDPIEKPRQRHGQSSRKGHRRG